MTHEHRAIPSPQVISKSLVAAASSSPHPLISSPSSLGWSPGMHGWETALTGQPPYGVALLSRFMVPQAEVISQFIEQRFNGSLGELFPRWMASLGRWQCCFSQGEMGGRGQGRHHLEYDGNHLASTVHLSIQCFSPAFSISSQCSPVSAWFQGKISDKWRP